MNTGRYPRGVGPAPALNCSVCGRRIGLRGAHFFVQPNVLMCGKCATWDNNSRTAHAARYPDCPDTWHDMWDHYICSATRAGAWYVLERAKPVAPQSELC
ncbi:hypothetical protein [Mycobacterium paraseoulense]|uniref:hypothetical protein n=1 Tax=Mycobacterium paraseoulense TaxID=590652 RepID=UPI00138D2703|nr:hypothetical protein [Mycobacterium paraseoulense]BBZ74142.1 hypothetical protein MPRS_52350 [Mycobacterium paraseoulense]